MQNNLLRYHRTIHNYNYTIMQPHNRFRKDKPFFLKYKIHPTWGVVSRLKGKYYMAFEENLSSCFFFQT